MYGPNWSSPTFVITAARAPSRAAATATFVAVPPSDLANVRTSASGTPICSGYRSTPTRPIVITSYTPCSSPGAAAARPRGAARAAAARTDRSRDLLDADGPPLAQRAPRGDPDHQRRARVGTGHRRRLARSHCGDERLPLAQVARDVALQVEVRQRGGAGARLRAHDRAVRERVLGRRHPRRAEDLDALVVAVDGLARV